MPAVPGLTARTFDRRQQVPSDAARGWMAAPRPADFMLRSAAAVLREGAGFFRGSAAKETSGPMSADDEHVVLKFRPRTSAHPPGGNGRTRSARAPITSRRLRRAISPATNGRATRATISVIACSPMSQRLAFTVASTPSASGLPSASRSPQDPGLRADGPPRLRQDFGDAAGVSSGFIRSYFTAVRYVLSFARCGTLSRVGRHAVFVLDTPPTHERNSDRKSRSSQAASHNLREASGWRKAGACEWRPLVALGSVLHLRASVSAYECGTNFRSCRLVPPPRRDAKFDLPSELWKASAKACDPCSDDLPQRMLGGSVRRSASFQTSPRRSCTWRRRELRFLAHFARCLLKISAVLDKPGRGRQRQPLFAAGRSKLSHVFVPRDRGLPSRPRASGKDLCWNCCIM